jgi:hypothetical protein
MTTPLTVTKFEARSHDSPDETRTPNKTRVEVVRLEGYTIGRFNFALVRMRQARGCDGFVSKRPCRLRGFGADNGPTRQRSCRFGGKSRRFGWCRARHSRRSCPTRRLW